MFRSVLLLILMLLVAAVALPAGPYGVNPARLLASANQALAANTGCMQHEAVKASAKPQKDCDAAQACDSCKLCQVCPHAVLAADVDAAPSARALFYTRPPHIAAPWLSAEHAPDFKPPIL